jgi:hypothetical protein
MLNYARTAKDPHEWNNSTNPQAMLKFLFATVRPAGNHIEIVVK